MYSPGEGKHGPFIVLGEVDRSLENASQENLAANRRFAQASGNIEAVSAARDAAMRGRTKDTIPAFWALTNECQAAFRTGFVDPLIVDAHRASTKRAALFNDGWRRAAIQCSVELRSAIGLTLAMGVIANFIPGNADHRNQSWGR
jgi:hypothetical protein